MIDRETFLDHLEALRRTLLGCLAARTLDRIFTRLESACDDLNQRLFRRLAVLLHEHELAVGTAREDGDRVAVADHLALRLASVRQLDVEKIDADDLPRVLALR